MTSTILVEFHVQQLSLRVHDTSLTSALRNLNPTTVAVIAEPYDCPSCSAIEGDYAPHLLPRLPVEPCTQPGGCTCWLFVTRDASFAHPAYSGAHSPVEDPA